MRKEMENGWMVKVPKAAGHSGKWLVILLWVLLMGPLCAGSPSLVLKQIAADDELAHAWVTTIHQDFLGFIWIGTSDGLYRYDGYEIEPYRSIVGDTMTLAGNNISVIYQDNKQDLWVGTTRGLNKYDRDQNRFFYQKDWPKENISDILEGSSDELYVGSYDGLFIYETNRQVFRVYYQYSADNEIYDGNQPLFRLNDTEILINGPHGLDIFNTQDKNFTQAYHFLNFPGWVSVSDIIRDYAGTVWVSTREKGLFYIRKETPGTLRKLEYDKDRQLFNTTLSLLQSSDSLLWIGTENNGICRVDLRKFYQGELSVMQMINEGQENSLLNNSVYSLFEDSQQNIWIGTYGGLNLYNPAYTNFRHVKTSLKEGGLTNNYINAFFEQGDKIWIATEGGINILNRKDNSFTYLRQGSGRASLSSDAVYAISTDPEGMIWIGTWSGGLNRYNPQTDEIKVFRVSGAGEGLSNNNIFSLVADKQGILWIGTMGGGLNRFDPSEGSFKSYVHDNLNPHSIPNNWVRQVFLDSRDRLWVSTYYSLDILDREKEVFTHFLYDEHDPKSISDNGAIVIFEDSKHHIWLGTETGLNLYHEADSSFSLYTVKDGLPSNVINAILEDDEGNLWLSTNEGIAKFIGGSHIPENPEFSVFDIKDGLQSNKFNQRSALRSQDGTLFFGGKNGFNSFRPTRIKANTKVPPVLITEFLIFNKKEILPGEEGIGLDRHITLAKEIRLKYKYRVFTINFVALNYIVPEKNQYQYMLEGFEEDWNRIGIQRNATYTNLDPGEYVFRVKASNNSSLWNEEGVELTIKIDPPWYRTIWAYILYALIILSIVLSYRRFILIRSHLQHELVLQSVEKDKIDQLGRMKTRFFTNISHEFRTPLTLILGPLDSLVSDINLKPKVIQKLSTIQKNARRMLRLINQLLDISEMEADHLKLKVSQGDVIVFVKEIASLFRWLAAQRQIEYTIHAEEDHFEGYFDSDKIEKICYNLLANAFKYTPDQGNIHVEISILPPADPAYDQQLKIVVKDSGVGISREDQAKIFEHFYRSERVTFSGKSGSGIGLALVQGLIKVYRGEIEVASEPDSGTCFTIRLPLSKDAFSDHEIDENQKDEMPLTIDIYDLEQGMEQNQAELTAAPNGDKHGIILVVEDHTEMRKHIAEILSEEYTILEAKNGFEALEICHDHTPDLIISDVRMPEMDGLELCQKLKSDQNTSHIPILMLTAKARDEDRLRGVNTGADAYITKPFETELLLATIRNLLASRQKMKDKYSRSVLIEPTEISITSVDEKFLRKAIGIVEKNIANPDYSVDTFSRDIGMSRSHLHRKFVGLTGHSPSGFIRTLRMKRAALLLTKGQLTVSEILFEVGIKSRSYFTKSFKEQFGYSPTDFVHRSRENSENKLNIDL